MDFLDLIQKTKAEGMDSLASPTFPFTPPDNPNQGHNNTSDTNKIILETDSTSIQIQKRTIIRIYIDATEEKITSFTIGISFDPQFFQVIDSDTTEAGVQINYIEPIFNVTKNNVNNSTGIITLQAKVENTEQAITLSRTIAEIELIPLKTGASEIKIIEENSNMLNTSSVNILSAVNSINFNINTNTEQTTNTDNQNTIYIPKTALNQDTKAFLSILSGILLVVSGLFIVKTIKNVKNNKS